MCYTRTHLRRFRPLVPITGLTFFFFAPGYSNCAEARRGGPLSSQQPQSQQTGETRQPATLPPSSSSPNTKAKKVWTNDDVIALRTPADNYVVEMETQEMAKAATTAEERAKKEALAKQIKEAGLAISLPSTVEETQRIIQAKQEEIVDLQEGRNRLANARAEASTDQSVVLQKQLDTIARNLEEAELQLKVLQQHLENLRNSTGKQLPAATPPDHFR